MPPPPPPPPPQQQQQQQQRRWVSESDAPALTGNLTRRGWHEAGSIGDADVVWCAAAGEAAGLLFGPDAPVAPRPGTVVNHFPRASELACKELLLLHVTRLQRRRARLGGPRPAAPPPPHAVLPPTYQLPRDYPQFAAHFQRLAAARAVGCWVLEPLGAAAAANARGVPRGGGAGGGGRLLIQPLHGAPRDGGAAASTAEPQEPPTDGAAGGTAGSTASAAAAAPAALPPLPGSGGAAGDGPERLVWWRPAPLRLAGGCWELRLYALVASAAPLLAYLSDLGFARQRPEEPPASEAAARLEGWAVRVSHCRPAGAPPAGRRPRRGKWALEDLKLHLAATRGHEATEELFASLRALAADALLAVAPAMGGGRGCFELLGLDMAVDEHLVPYLTRIKVDPSLGGATKPDRLLKFRLVSDVLDAVTPGDWSEEQRAAAAAVAGPAAQGAAAAGAPREKARQEQPPLSCPAAACGGRDRIGSFELLYDERRDPAWLQAQAEQAQAKAAAAAEAAQRHGARWRARPLPPPRRAQPRRRRLPSSGPC